MAQVSQIAIDNQTFATFRTVLNNSLNAINSSHIGSTAPSSVTAGTIWVDNGTSGKLKVKLNDGTDNIELFEIDISSNAISSNMSTTGTISETDPNAIPFAVALGG